MTNSELSKLKSLAEAAKWLDGKWYATYEENVYWRVCRSKEGNDDSVVMEFSLCEEAAKLCAAANPQVILSLIGQLEAANDNYYGSEIDRKYFEHELVPQLQSQYQKLKSASDKLVEALEFYADCTRYISGSEEMSSKFDLQKDDSWQSSLGMDNRIHRIGKRAREALAQYKSEITETNKKENE